MWPSFTGVTRTPAAVRDLSPGVFAFVMATGIVSVAFHDVRVPSVSYVLLWIGVAGYVALLVATGWRLLRFRDRLVADLVGPYGFAFLTVVAASDVLANRLALDSARWAAAVLLAIGVLGWLGLGYGVPIGMIAGVRGETSFEQVNGTWFLWVVATQSVTVAVTTLEPGGPAGAMAVFAAVCWAVGLVLYLLVAALVLTRLLVRSVGPAQLIPAYWIFMGAGAITVLAGAQLTRLPGATRFVPHVAIVAVSVVVWSFCTWLIPLLLALSVWRHALHRVSLRYESGLWSMVFPVGMYGVATHHLGVATGTGWLTDLGAGEAWVALAVWAAVFAAMLIAAARHARRLSTPPGPR